MEYNINMNMNMEYKSHRTKKIHLNDNDLNDCYCSKFSMHYFIVLFIYVEYLKNSFKYSTNVKKVIT